MPTLTMRTICAIDVYQGPVYKAFQLEPSSPEGKNKSTTYANKGTQYLCSPTGTSNLHLLHPVMKREEGN